MQALEEKYDALRDKLLMEALIAQVGETEWKLLSEQERQRKLMQLKLEERRLRQEGQLEKGGHLAFSPSGSASFGEYALYALVSEIKVFCNLSY